MRGARTVPGAVRDREPGLVGPLDRRGAARLGGLRSGVAAVYSVLVLAAAVGGFVLLFNRRPAVEA